MDKFIKKWKSAPSSSSQITTQNQESLDEVQVRSSNLDKEVPERVNITPVEDIAHDTFSLINEFDIASLPTDPADRKPILLFHPNIRDEVRRYYIKKGSYQPRNHEFPQTRMSGSLRRFNPTWFDLYQSWMEYSIKKDAVFCLPCYLFHNEKSKHGGGDTYAVEGFKAWNKSDRFPVHVGRPSSTHNQCSKMCVDLMNQKQSIQTSMVKQKEKEKKRQIEYRIRLNASVDIARLLLMCGFPFRGHDESESSNRKGNFLTILEWYAERCEKVGAVVSKKAPKNIQLTCPKIQKDIVHACARETIKAIIEDIGDDYFAILVDESRDVSHKEQMALVLRYVDRRGFVVERLVGLVHVRQTSALVLKEAVYSLLAQHSLSPHQIRGQCYDGASNMQGHSNGLRTLIMNDSRSAHCVHCFAHQLQLTLVAVAKTHDDVEWLFEIVGIVLNVVGASFKNRDKLRDTQGKNTVQALRSGELETGRGLNQELGLKRPGDTRWGSHYDSLLNIFHMFPSLIEVIDVISVEGSTSTDRQKACGLLDYMQSFRFVFMLHLMKNVLEITNELNTSLQRREQDIVNAMLLLATTKRRLQEMRDNGWEDLILKTTTFCCQNNINVLDMDDMHALRGSKMKRRVDDVTNGHYYRVSILYAVVDMQIQELNCRFNEVNTELLLGMACLNPVESFSSYDKTKLLAMARLYPADFESEIKIHELSGQLDSFIANMQDDSRFSNLDDIGALAKKLVQTKQHLNFPRVFLLLKLALLLPVATATVERAFSAMKYIKTDLRSRMNDEMLNDCLITYVEKDIFENISNETIMHHFQTMKTHRGQL